MAEKQAFCPECNKPFTLRGLNGHLRFAHGMDSKKARAVSVDLDDVAVEEEEDFLDDHDKIMRLADLMGEVSKRREWIEEDNSLERITDKTVMKTLDHLERRIASDLSELRGAVKKSG